MGQVQDVMIDWYAMVKHTKTGITNPREYQMLWRHLAYREPLIEEFEDDFKPLVSLSFLQTVVLKFCILLENPSIMMVQKKFVIFVLLILNINQIR